MRKKSSRKAARAFIKDTKQIATFLRAMGASSLSQNHISWAYDYAVIRLYREFEGLILNCLIAAINSDTAQLSRRTGISFPKHLTDEVCGYIIVQNGYFDFHGRDGLISTLKKFLPEDHYLVKVIKKPSYKVPLQRLCALRNHAAHESKPSRRRALEAVGARRLSASGAWLKVKGRFHDLMVDLQGLADEIATQAPY